MANKTVADLKAKTDATWAKLSRQLQGMEPHMERTDAPGEWTTRQVLSHLLFEPGFDPVAALKMFSERDFPTRDIVPGQTSVDDQRRKMTLPQFIAALDTQRRSVFAYLDGLPEEELHRRKMRIPLFKQIMGTDEIAIPVWVGALFDYHWNDHAGQLAKIRQAAGLPEA